VVSGSAWPTARRAPGISAEQAALPRFLLKMFDQLAGRAGDPRPKAARTRTLLVAAQRDLPPMLRPSAVCRTAMNRREPAPQGRRQARSSRRRSSRHESSIAVGRGDRSSAAAMRSLPLQADGRSGQLPGESTASRCRSTATPIDQKWQNPTGPGVATVTVIDSRPKRLAQGASSATVNLRQQGVEGGLRLFGAAAIDLQLVPPSCHFCSRTI